MWPYSPYFGHRCQSGDAIDPGLGCLIVKALKLADFRVRQHPPAPAIPRGCGAMTIQTRVGELRHPGFQCRVDARMPRVPHGNWPCPASSASAADLAGRQFPSITEAVIAAGDASRWRRSRRSWPDRHRGSFPRRIEREASTPWYGTALRRRSACTLVGEVEVRCVDAHRPRRGRMLGGQHSARVILGTIVDSLAGASKEWGAPAIALGAVTGLGDGKGPPDGVSHPPSCGISILEARQRDDYRSEPES